ncbi:hypothetical protein EVJ58_g5268 [Rhodofomes roseus]|uniref:Uncharacterized protein n=1 Tax=Rhodofomes roseus TaxID=34475 RepID=A0A4Y9YE31_9APHY|nr:hypothetical protein EVJ58_g5268 [Rhodofomes roseus]
MDQPQVRREELKTEADRGDGTSLHLTSRLKKSLPILFNYRSLSARAWRAPAGARRCACHLRATATVDRDELVNMFRAQNVVRSLRRGQSWRAPPLHRNLGYLRGELLKSLEEAQPVYEMKPQWWQRGTYLVVLVNLIATIGSIELVWKHWTYWEPHPREAELDTGATSASAGERTGEYVLRPWYQRGIAVALQMGFGGFIGGLLLGTRQRDVRRMFLLPRTWPPAPKAAALPRPSRLPPAAASPEKTEERWLILQSLINMNFTGKGIAVPMNQCDLGKGRDDSELKIKVNGITTPFLVRLDGNSKVCGEKLSVGQARDEIFKWWYGEALGKKLRGSERWKELP